MTRTIIRKDYGIDAMLRDAKRKGSQESRPKSVAAIASSCGIFPGTQNGVTRLCRYVLFANRKKFPSNEPAHRSLHRTLRNPDALRKFLIADLNRRISRVLLLRSKPQVHEEADGSAVVADQVAHKYAGDVRVYG